MTDPKILRDMSFFADFTDEELAAISKIIKKKTYKILTVLQRKLMHLVHDIIDRGICYRYEAKKRIKEKQKF